MTQSDVGTALARKLKSVEFNDVVAAYLFGSEARGTPHAESDVDVAVLLDRARHPSARERFERRLALMAALADTVRSRSLDLLVLNDLPPLFARRIVLDGRQFHCLNPETTREFVRDVQLLAADLEPFLRRTRRIKLEGLRGA